MLKYCVRQSKLLTQKRRRPTWLVCLRHRFRYLWEIMERHFLQESVKIPKYKLQVESRRSKWGQGTPTDFRFEHCVPPWRSEVSLWSTSIVSTLRTPTRPALPAVSILLSRGTRQPVWTGTWRDPADHFRSVFSWSTSLVSRRWRFRQQSVTPYSRAPARCIPWLAREQLCLCLTPVYSTNRVEGDSKQGFSHCLVCFQVAIWVNPKKPLVTYVSSAIWSIKIHARLFLKRWRVKVGTIIQVT